MARMLLLHSGYLNPGRQCNVYLASNIKFRENSVRTCSRSALQFAVERAKPSHTPVAAAASLGQIHVPFAAHELTSSSFIAYYFTVSLASEMWTDDKAVSCKQIHIEGYVM